MEDFDFGVRQTLSTELSPLLVHKLMGRLKLANFMDLPEGSFKDVIRQIESDPLFRKLCYTYEPAHKVISFSRYPCAVLVRGNVFELNEEITPQGPSFDIESLLASYPDIVAIIRRLSMEKFRQYFLYGDDLTIPEIARACGIDIPEVEKITELVNSVLIHQEVVSPGVGPVSPDADNQVRFSKVASLEKHDGRFVVAFFRPTFVRGRYRINYERLKALEAGRLFNREEMRHIRHLLKRLELVNTRKTITYRILEAIIRIQGAYLETGKSRELRPFLMKNLSAMFNVSLGMVSRAIAGKSVDTAWGEKSLRFFFPSGRWSKRELVLEVIDQEDGKPYSDQEIRDIVEERYGIVVSRRAVNAYRLSLKIDSSYARAGRCRQGTESPAA